MYVQYIVHRCLHSGHYLQDKITLAIDHENLTVSVISFRVWYRRCVVPQVCGTASVWYRRRRNFEDFYAFWQIFSY